MNNNKITKNITFINTFFSLLLQVTTIISGFIIPRLILKTFGSDVNGLVSSLNQFLSYISLIEGGLTGVVLASLYKPLSEKNYDRLNSIIKAANNFFKKIAIIFMIYTLLLSIIYPLVVKTNFSFNYICTLTWILSINLFMQYFFSITWKILLQADKKVALISIVQIICIVLNTISVVALIKIFPNIHIVKLATAIIYLIQPIVFNRYVDKYFKIDKNVQPDKEAISQRWNGFGINIAAFIHNNTDVILLTLLTNLKDVSIYSIYYLVVNGLKSLIISISTGIVPTLGHTLAQKENGKINKLFNNYEFVMILITFIFFTLGGILITPFVQVYTKGINDTNYYQPIFGWLMVIAEMLFCIREPYLQVAYCSNKFKEISKYAYIEAFLNITISLLFISKLGIIGVAIGTIVAMAYRTGFHIWYLKNNILKRKIIYSIKNIAIFSFGFIVSIILSNILFSFSSISILSLIIYAIENGILIIGIYTIIIIIFYRKNMREILKINKK